MVTSRWDDMLGAVVDAMRAVSGYGDPATLTGSQMAVFYGPDYLTREIPSQATVLCLGWSGDESPEDAGEWSQEPAGQAAVLRSRDEEGRIRFRVVAQRGDLDFRAAVSSAFGVLGDLETCVRTDPYAGLGAGSNVRWVQVLSGRPQMWPAHDEVTGQSGAYVFVDGELLYRARI